MKMVVTGGTAEKRKLARKAIRWAVANDLKLKRDINLNVRFKDNKLEWYGEAYHVAPSSFNSKSFTIVISDNIDFVKEYELLVETILHEMVHVWQMANRTARFSLNSSRSKYKVFWKGTEMTNLSYSRQPWERQAFRMEKTLAKKFRTTV